MRAGGHGLAFPPRVSSWPSVDRNVCGATIARGRRSCATCKLEAAVRPRKPSSRRWRGRARASPSRSPAAVVVALLRLHRRGRLRAAAARHAHRARSEPRHPARRPGHRRVLAAHLGLRPLGEHPLRSRAAGASGASGGTLMPATTAIGEPSAIAMAFFFLFIAITLGITWWAARRTRTTEQFYAAGRTITAGQNGFALAGDYMSAASFLGIAGLVSTTGFDGLIYSTGWLVGWPVVLFLIAEPLRNLGRYTFSDVVALRFRADAGPHRRRDRHARDRDLLPDRADGRRRRADQAHVRALLRAGDRDRRRGDDRLRAVRRHDRDDLGADREGGAAPGRRGDPGAPGARALRHEPGALFAAAAERYGDGRARAGTAGHEPARRHLARHGADVRHRRPAAHPDALLHRARRARGADARSSTRPA